MNKNKDFFDDINWNKVISDTYKNNNKYNFIIDLGLGPIFYNNIDEFEEMFINLSYEELNTLLEKFTEQFDEFNLKISPEIAREYGEYGTEITEQIDVIYQNILNIYDLLFADEDLIADSGYEGIYFPSEFYESLTELLNIKLNDYYLFSIR